MMKFSELRKQLEKDCELSIESLEMDSLRVPYKASKYINMLFDAKFELNQEEIKYKSLYKKKFEHYKVEYQIKLNAAELNNIIESDDQMLKLQANIILFRQKVEFLEHALKTVQNQSFNIKNAIEMIKYKNGG